MFTPIKTSYPVDIPIRIIPIAAAETVGPYALVMTNNSKMLRQLCSWTHEEALINAFGEFAKHDTDNQKIVTTLLIINNLFQMY